ncbi:AGAP005605-PA [Anopheles gambiae str. PEST]|uniref:CDAN1-interacting nuclease 1 n=1 Tax=Anopheles gambiae TaxID=7165 RepID=Q7Q6Y3_ANOGA|nr:CDAN1-interacting nuclease 1 [Anopheles coluzzii]EAA11868.3 AGAP005605-PA [Anopheles gambiae str. PEST]
MVVISVKRFTEIQNFIRNYHGLFVNCNMELEAKFPEYSSDTLGSITAKEVVQRVKSNHSKISAKAASLVKEYQTTARQTLAHDVLQKMAIELQIPSVVLCRILLAKIYSDMAKSEVNEMLRMPDLIPDSLLAVNVSYCLYSETMDGPITDLVRRFIGEEYEVRLKKMARDAGMVFYDEGDLRRTGYDKTPDLKMAVPFMYRGQVINWIESKASFGDMESHKRYVKDQLSSYGNRFGPGIVIYWFGYLETIADCPENGNYVIVTDGFPAKDEMEFLTFNLPAIVEDDDTGSEDNRITK